MNTETSSTTVIANRGGTIFFKCPIGGFASLLPGVCPKCHEPLAPVVSAEQVGEQGEGNASAPNAHATNNQRLQRGSR